MTWNKTTLVNQINQNWIPKLFLYPYVAFRSSPCSACLKRIQAVQDRTNEVTHGSIRWASPNIVQDCEKLLFDQIANAATKYGIHSLQDHLWSLPDLDLVSSGVSFAKSMHQKSMKARGLVTLYNRWGEVIRPADEDLRRPRQALISRLPETQITLR